MSSFKITKTDDEEITILFVVVVLKLVAVCIYRFVMTRFDNYDTYGYCYYETSLVKHVPKYDVTVLRCYVTYRSCISYTIIKFEHCDQMSKDWPCNISTWEIKSDIFIVHIHFLPHILEPLSRLKTMVSEDELIC